MDEFSQAEAELLKPYVTNTNKNVFGLINLPQVVCGALFSRYSRSSKSARRVLLEEFMQDPQMHFAEIVGSAKNSPTQLIATKKAEEFYDRVLVGFGDDSVAELGGAHIACEQISNLATKFTQDSRIGISPLEKSTRYVYFDKKQDGKYLYYCGKEITESEVGKIYEKTCDLLFDTYVSLMQKVSEKLMQKYPREKDASERAYSSAIRAKTCDILRGLLPAGTLTNSGFYGNGRSFEYLLTKMYSSDLPEVKNLATQMQEELSFSIPSFVKRANNKYGIATQQYWIDTRTQTKKLVEDKFLTANLPKEKNSTEESTPEVQLIYFDENAHEKLSAAILFEFGMDYASAKKKASSLSKGQQLELISSYVGKRGNRRQKPGRAFEHVFYTFAICANFGQFRDLHRHRILTQMRQPLSCENGYDMPPELVQMGLDFEFSSAMQEAKASYEQINSVLGPALAQYVVPMAYRMKWYMHLNLRETFHLIELRSAPQGHTDYRRVVIKMLDEMKAVQPELANFIIFANREDIALERLDAEKRIDERLKKIDEKKY
ncbi:MAG: FAD-dependent thymidylate synthase [Candidatus Micrarchaeia archaeon]